MIRNILNSFPILSKRDPQRAGAAIVAQSLKGEESDDWFI